MKPASHVTSKGMRLMPLKTENPIDALYGCLKDLPGNPLTDLEAEHRAEIEADGHRQHRGML